MCRLSSQLSLVSIDLLKILKSVQGVKFCTLVTSPPPFIHAINRLPKLCILTLFYKWMLSQEHPAKAQF